MVLKQRLIEFYRGKNKVYAINILYETEQQRTFCCLAFINSHIQRHSEPSSHFSLCKHFPLQISLPTKQVHDGKFLTQSSVLFILLTFPQLSHQFSARTIKALDFPQGGVYFFYYYFKIILNGGWRDKTEGKALVLLAANPVQFPASHMIH